MATIEVQPTNGTHDGYRQLADAAKSFVTDNGYVRCGTLTYLSVDYTYDGFIYFSSVAIPQYAQIDVAELRFYADSDNAYTVVDTQVSLEDSDDATLVTDWDEYEAASKTTPVAWDNIGAWTGGTWDADAVSPSLVDSIQAIVNKAGWASGQAMQVFWESTAFDAWAYRDGEEYDDSPTNSPKLHIEYSIVAPTVTTQAVDDIADTTATGNGTIESTGGENCDKRGVCWNTIGTPTVADDKAEETDSFGAGVFDVPMTGLSKGEFYHVRAYAHNSIGYSYGSEVTFWTTGLPTGCEDFTTYTEVDEYSGTPPGHVSKTQATCTALTLRRDETSYIYKDKGIGHFDGDFEHTLETRVTESSASLAQWAIWALWVLTVGDIKDGDDANDEGFLVRWRRDSVSADYYLELTEFKNGNDFSHTSIALSIETTYYLTIARAGGQITCKIYDNLSKGPGDLVDVLTLNQYKVTDVATFPAGASQNAEDRPTVWNPDLNRAYSFGGSPDNEVTILTAIYKWIPGGDPVKVADLDTAVSKSAVVYDQNTGLYYIYGGMTGQAAATNVIQWFDPSDDTEGTLGYTLPVAVGGLAGVHSTVNHHNYIFGGCFWNGSNWESQDSILRHDPDDSEGDGEIYDLANETPSVEMNHKYTLGDQVVYVDPDDVAYIIGGKYNLSGGGALDYNEIQKFDCAAETLSVTSLVMPHTIAASPACYYDPVLDRVFVCGGSNYNVSIYYKDVWTFDPDNDDKSWGASGANDLMPAENDDFWGVYDTSTNKAYWVSWGSSQSGVDMREIYEIEPDIEAYRYIYGAQSLDSDYEGAVNISGWCKKLNLAPAKIIEPSAIASTEAFGTAQLNQALTMPAIPSAEAFGTCHVRVEVDPQDHVGSVGWFDEDKAYDEDTGTYAYDDVPVAAMFNTHMFNEGMIGDNRVGWSGWLTVNRDIPLTSSMVRIWYTKEDEDVGEPIIEVHRNGEWVEI